MMSTTMEALAHLRRELNQPVTLPPTAERRQAQRLQRIARAVVKRPPPSRMIDHLYDELRALAAAPSNPEGEARYHELLKRLRVLEAEDARRLRQELATSGPLKLGEVDAALREARELRARYEHAVPSDTSGKRTDP